MAFHRADQRQRNAGAAAGIFHDGTVRPQAPVGLRRFDHGKCHAVLHAAGRVLTFKLQQDTTVVCGNNFAQGHQGGAADAVENGFLQPAHDVLEAPRWDDYRGIAPFAGRTKVGVQLGPLSDVAGFPKYTRGWTDSTFNCGVLPVASIIKKNLVLVLNNKRYNPQDFIDIGGRVARKASDIEVYAVTAGSPPSILEAAAWQRPTLTVAFSTAGAFSPVRGSLLIGKRIEKLDQAEALERAGVSVPPVRLFEPGLQLDPSIWGDYVLLKPTPLEASSHGEGIQLFRSSRLEKMTLADFPEQHPIHKHPMMVQKFIDTGEYPCKYRA